MATDICNNHASLKRMLPFSLKPLYLYDITLINFLDLLHFIDGTEGNGGNN